MCKFLFVNNGMARLAYVKQIVGGVDVSQRSALNGNVVNMASKRRAATTFASSARPCFNRLIDYLRRLDDLLDALTRDVVSATYLFVGQPLNKKTHDF